MLIFDIKYLKPKPNSTVILTKFNLSLILLFLLNYLTNKIFQMLMLEVDIITLMFIIYSIEFLYEYSFHIEGGGIITMLLYRRKSLLNIGPISGSGV